MQSQGQPLSTSAQPAANYSVYGLVFEYLTQDDQNKKERRDNQRCPIRAARQHRSFPPFGRVLSLCKTLRCPILHSLVETLQIGFFQCP